MEEALRIAYFYEPSFYIWSRAAMYELLRSSLIQGLS